eukprot:6179386-Pleurochrysis_carterae.AAC.1
MAVKTVRCLDVLGKRLNDAVVDALHATSAVLSACLFRQLRWGRVAPSATRTTTSHQPRARPRYMSAPFSTRAHALIAWSARRDAPVEVGTCATDDAA